MSYEYSEDGLSACLYQLPGWRKQFVWGFRDVMTVRFPAFFIFRLTVCHLDVGEILKLRASRSLVVRLQG